MTDSSTLIGSVSWPFAWKSRGYPKNPGWLELKRHPQSNETCIKTLSAQLEWLGGGAMAVSFIAEGDISGVNIPARRSGKRKDNLWRTTCFELFAGFDAAPEYWEANISLSTDWAVYRFSSYRRNMRDEAKASVGKTIVRHNKRRLTLDALLTLDPLKTRNLRTVRFGLAAIIEDKSGGKSYWALRHPLGKPDFHHRNCFLLASR